MSRLTPILLLALLTCGGCSFHRSVVNPQFRELETSWIRPGVTTRREVVSRLGIPPIGREAGTGTGRNAFRWTVSDTFAVSLVAGYIVTPTFEKGRQHFAEDILIVFDDRDVVTLVSRTRSPNGRKPEIVEWREVAK